MGCKKYKNGFEVTCHEGLLDEPFKWKKPRRIFVNSMSDLFHEQVPADFILRVFDVMNRCPQHIFQVLTKRSERLKKLEAEIGLRWSENIWLGVSVENKKVKYRIEDLIWLYPSSRIRFLSCEPLLESLGRLPLVFSREKFNLSKRAVIRETRKIDWIIVGGESGPGARLIRGEWVRSIRTQCQENKIPFFFKQWGGVQKHRSGRRLDNLTYDEMPEGY